MSSFTEALNTDTWYILADRNWAFVAILVVLVWKYFGFHMMIYIAALQGVPKDLLEASKLDGATRTQAIWYVKIPLIMSGITISIFFSILGALQTFDLIMPLTGGGPSHTTHTLVSYLYTFGITRMNVGFGSAVGVVLFVCCVIFAFTYQSTIMKEKNKEFPMFAMRKIRWGKYIFLMLVAGFVLIPMFATVLGGFKSLGELRTNPLVYLTFGSLSITLRSLPMGRFGY